MNTSYKQIIDPRSEQLTEITNGLNAFGLAQTPGEVPSRVAIIGEQSCGETVAGAIGHSLRQRFYLTQLWVSDEHRSKGIGSALVAQMETIAKQRNCHDIVADTLNNHAVSFYERLGFRVYLVNPNYIRGFDWHFLIKAFSQQSRNGAQS